MILSSFSMGRIGEGQFSHFLHEHLLIYRNAVDDKTRKRKLKCELCNEGIDKGAYLCCEWCPGFGLHNWCAHQPDMILHHPLHPQHKLELRHAFDMNLATHLVCEACLFREKGGYCYVCFECNFFIHISCLPLSMNRSNNRSKKVLLKHACHPEHDLVLYQAKDKAINKYMFYGKCCSWCEKSVLFCDAHALPPYGNHGACLDCDHAFHEGVYACLNCKVCLHDKCAFKVPLEIKHPSHPAHTLHFKQLKKIYGGTGDQDSVCCACKGGMKDFRKVMYYICGSKGCGWKIHGRCTSFLPSLKHRCHEHSLTYFRNEDFEGDFSCDKCRGGTQKDNFSGFYRCTTCDSNFHLSCILQNAVKHRYHWHSLALVNPTEDDDSEQHFCDICEEERDPKHSVYSCNKCIYSVSHIECAFDQERPGFLKLQLKGSFQILQYLEVKYASNTASNVLGKGGQKQIHYPYHEHILCLDDVKNLKRRLRYCKCCKKFVSVLAFICYTCGEYCLHKKCSELPYLLRSSLHHPYHSLILKLTHLRGKRYVCDVCGEVNDKYCPYYQCQNCNFILDTKCAFLKTPSSRRQIFKKLESYHFSHKHKLQLGNFKKHHQSFCDYCASQIIGLGYCCWVCDFFLHQFCFEQLPREMSHPFHSLHPLMIRISNKKEPVCLACGLKTFKTISYGCVKCVKMSLHSICAPSVNRSLKYESSHNHMLYYFGREVALKIQTFGGFKWFECDKCLECCRGAFYRCLECKLNFHVECIMIPRIVKSKYHDHPVKLVKSFTVKGYDSQDQYCDVCEEKRYTNDHAYSCEQCSDFFVGHVDCVLSQVEEVIRETRTSTNPRLFELNSNYKNIFRNEYVTPRIEEQIVCQDIDMGNRIVDLHPTKPWILTCKSNFPKDIGVVEIWNYQTQKLLWENPLIVEESYLESIKFIEQENWIALGDVKGLIIIYDVETLKMIHEFHAHKRQVDYLAVHPNQPYLLSFSSSTDESIKFWDWKRGWLCKKIFPSQYIMQAVAFNPYYPDIFACGLRGDALTIWNMHSPDSPYTFRAHMLDDNGFGFRSIDFFMAEDKLYLVAGFHNGTIKVWDHETKCCVQTIRYCHKESVKALCVHPELPILISFSDDDTVGILKSTNNNYSLVKKLDFQLGSVHSVSCKKGSNIIVFGCQRGTVIVKVTDSKDQNATNLELDLEVEEEDSREEIIFMEV